MTKEHRSDISCKFSKLFYPKISCCDISLSIRQISHKSLETIASSDKTVASPTVQQGREGPEPFFPT